MTLPHRPTAVILDLDGTLLDTDYFETSGAVADQPAVAAATGPSSGSFLVVWREASLDIKGRRVVASAATPLTTVTFFSGASNRISVRPSSWRPHPR